MLASAVTQKPHPGRETATVTRPKSSIEIAKEFSTKTMGVRPPKRRVHTDDGEIIADAEWPGMYRVKWRDGGVSDMVNYIRAKWLLISPRSTPSSRSFLSLRFRIRAACTSCHVQ
jgi:hypothetical protein